MFEITAQQNFVIYMTECKKKLMLKFNELLRKYTAKRSHKYHWNGILKTLDYIKAT